MSWLRASPSLPIVLAINLAWLLIAALSNEHRPLGDAIWRGEMSPVEKLEVAFLVAYIAAWTWVTARLRRPRTLPFFLAAGMVVQLIVLLGEELDWLGALQPFRNFREVLHLFLPQVLDTPAAAAYLLAFLLAPLVPGSAVRGFLERAAPVNAERGDAWALVAVPVCWPVVHVLVGDQKLGELHQVCIYAVVGVITARIVREIRAK